MTTKKPQDSVSITGPLVVRDEEELLAPEKEGSKLALPKTWISEKQLLKILQRTPQEHVYKRPGKGGQTWDYVTGVYVEKVLNYVFGWNWDFEIIKQEVVGLETGYGQVITLGKLTVKDEGHQIVKTQNGRADIKYRKDSKVPLDLGNDYKASATDCLKKCASLLGIANDVYGKNEFKEVFTAKEKAHKEVKEAKVVTAEVVEHECTSCGEPLKKAEFDFSMKIHKKALCRKCQKS